MPNIDRNKPSTYFEIQHYALLDGWVGTWYENGRPILFESRAAAEKEFRDFWVELQDSVEAGEIEPYSRGEFRIAEILTPIAASITSTCSHRSDSSKLPYEKPSR